VNTWLVTGGAGFIGSNFVRAALESSDARIVVVDKLTYAGNLQSLAEVSDNPRYGFVQADIADREAVRGIFREHQPTVVVNFAAESHVDRSIDGPSAFVETNIVGTFELLEASRQLLSQADRSARDAFRFLHVSTDEVYGSLGPTGAFEETTPYEPNSVYSASKASADHLVRAYQETFGVPSLVTNCSNNYGPHQFPEKLIPLMILNATEGKPLPIYGDGGNVRDWLYVDDHCRAIDLTLQKGKSGETYCIGGLTEDISNLDLVKKIIKLMDKSEDSIEFIKDRPGHDRRYAVDFSKAKKELGYQPQHDLDTYLKKTIDWYIKNKDWWQRVKSKDYQKYYQQWYGR